MLKNIWKVYSKDPIVINDFFQVIQCNGNPEDFLSKDLHNHPEWNVTSISKLNDNIIELFYNVDEN